MEAGSIEAVVARLKLWSSQRRSGLARVEWDSVYARQQVVAEMRATANVIEVEIAPLDSAYRTIGDLLDQLAGIAAGSLVSLTGVEGIFPDSKRRLETLVALSFQRERLASFALKQIWWIPSHLVEQFILGVPDLESWFQLRVQLTQVVPSAKPLPPPVVRGFESADLGAPKAFYTEEASSPATRFQERSTAARDRGIPALEVWSELGQPAYTALAQAGKMAEAREVLGAFRELVDPQSFRAMLTSDGENYDQRKAKSLETFAVALNQSGEHEIAKGLEQVILAASTQFLGAANLDTLAIKNNLAQILYDVGDDAEAAAMLRELLQTSRLVLGPEHPTTLMAMSNLSTILRDKGELSEARALQERAVEVSSRTFGEEHEATLLAVNNLGNTMLLQGDVTRARRLQERLLETSRHALGEDHPTTSLARRNLDLLSEDPTDKAS